MQKLHCSGCGQTLCAGPCSGKMGRLDSFFQCTSSWEERQRLFHLHPSSPAPEGIPLPGNLGPQLPRPGAETEVKVCVAESCSALCDLRDSSWSNPSVQGILQTRILEWVAISFSSGSLSTQGWNPDLLHCR